MKTVGKIIGIVLLIAVIVAVLFLCFMLVCNALGWCTDMVSWVDTNIFNKIGIDVYKGN